MTDTEKFDAIGYFIKYYGYWFDIGGAVEADISPRIELSYSFWGKSPEKRIESYICEVPGQGEYETYTPDNVNELIAHLKFCLKDAAKLYSLLERIEVEDEQAAEKAHEEGKGASAALSHD